MRATLLLLALLPLAACEGRFPESDEGDRGPIAQTEVVVGGVSYAVELGLVHDGRAGDVYISEYNHPELAGDEALARQIARAACTGAGRSFDEGVEPLAQARASWLFIEACR